ncbi:4'-phosphopantetheinyl transferase family protein [Nonomuraea lactucae]|uniref:4'-phosphopantetheinyl transferase family protein n=1 Tax=Nonomuraea lactucae TaxID=2249762 RepID=UPI000DE56E3A|nr:4'-phosphopantetheinyl transferase superfamily protein [Nonomuraea lactucae]
MIEEILPDTVVAVEAFENAVDPMLFPEEEALIARAVRKRRDEFATVRACARAALAKLGLPAVPILPGERGAPTWPDGVVGSMSHCDGYRVCAVAPSADVMTVGVDAEPNAAVPDGVLGAVSDPAERAWIAELTAARPEVSWDRLLFCAKEAVYKAWFPLTRRWLDFSEATVTVDPRARTFTARLLLEGHTPEGRPITGFEGRWLASRDLLVTAIAVPREGRHQR